VPPKSAPGLVGTDSTNLPTPIAVILSPVRLPAVETMMVPTLAPSMV
jgi:hypothetical protein